MVHDIYESDVWFHDIANKLFYGGTTRAYFSKPSLFKHIPRQCDIVVEQYSLAIPMVKEKQILDEYLEKSTGIRADRSWYNKMLDQISKIQSLYSWAKREFNNLSEEELDAFAIVDITREVDKLVDLMWERYLFDREVEYLLGIRKERKAVNRPPYQKCG